MVAGENALARRGIAQVIDAQPDMRVVGDFDCCRAGMQAVLTKPPHAIIVQIDAGAGHVIDAIERCLNAAPGIGVVVIASSREPEIAERAIKAGARAYLHHGAGPNTLADAVRDAVAGRLHVCRCIASPLLQQKLFANGRHKERYPDLAKLSAREFQVFQLIGSGWENPRIADALGISIKTLHAHKENLKTKLNLPTATSLRQTAAGWQAGAE